ncbi:MAG TPA: hypothetical protein VMU51_04475 [Mycobacteriales bacterium]|nr:hypothetical protein [Mycobacteriales bacterium]
MDHTASLPARARLAAARARAADPDLSRLTPDTTEWRLRALHTRTVAAALGIDPATVVVSDDPPRRTGRYPAYLITVYEDTTVPGPDPTGPVVQTGRVLYRLIPEPGVEGSYLLLQPCPGCHAPVPGSAVASLVDLGRVLTGDQALLTPYARWDPGHEPGCRLFQPTR